MTGISYLTNERGQRTAVVIDLRRHRNIWEDIHDLLVLASRKDEPRSKWPEAKKRLEEKTRCCG